MVQHGTGIAGDVRLTLGAVDDNFLYLRQVLHRQFDGGGEARSAQAHHTAVADRSQEALVVVDVRRGQSLIELAEPVRLNSDRLNILAVYLQVIADFGHLTGDAGVYGRGYKASRLGDQLADLYLVANRYHRHRRNTHPGHHGDGHPRRRGDPFRRLSRSRLALGQPYSAQFFHVVCPPNFILYIFEGSLIAFDR